MLTAGRKVIWEMLSEMLSLNSYFFKKEFVDSPIPLSILTKLLQLEWFKKCVLCCL